MREKGRVNDQGIIKEIKDSDVEVERARRGWITTGDDETLQILNEGRKDVDSEPIPE